MWWLCALAAGSELDDPYREQAWRLLRAEQNLVLYGSPDRSQLSLASALYRSTVHDDWWRERYGALYRYWEVEDLVLDDPRRAWWDPVVGMRTWTRVTVGDGRTQGLLGDPEAGLLSVRGGADVFAYTPWFEVHAQPQVRLDLGGVVEPVAFPLVEAWGGVHHGPLRAGFGMERRWVGPGRHGSLILGDDALPMPMGDVALEGEVWKLGLLRAQVGAGWLQADRLDVDNPGLLLMDVRWSPAPWLELGASRLSLFAGEGRPMPSVGQLLLPLDPHVYDDPELEEPDQDEIAALDARVTLPLPAPFDYLEVYTQYGGDDMIVRELGPLPYPTLAGIANLFGGELSAGPVSLNLEWARIRDDRFRWYTQHRVYHQGFTQDGRWIGHLNGGDQTTWWARAAYQPGPVGGVVWFEHVDRTLVLDVVGDQVLAGIAEEQRLRGGAQLRWFRDNGVLTVGYDLERTLNQDFVPGADDWKHRVSVSWQGAPWTLYGLADPGW